MDVLRALAVLLVIVEHALVLAGTSTPAHLWAVGAVSLPFRMPALMLLSGMLLSRSLAKPLWTYLRGKVDRIAWPYLVWSCLIIAVHLGTGDAAGQSWWQLLHPTGPMFYLQYLLLYYLIAIALPSRVRTWSVVPAFVAASLFSDEAERFFYLWGFFLLGDVLGRHTEALSQALSRRLVVGVAIVLGMATSVYALTGARVRYEPEFALGTLAGVVALIAACRWTSGTTVGAWVAPYGRQTIVFYVASWPAQLLVVHFLTRSGVPEAHLLVALLVMAGLAAGGALVRAQRGIPALRYLFDMRPRGRRPRPRT